MDENMFNSDIEDTNSYKKLTLIETKNEGILSKKSRLIIVAMLLAFFAVSLIVFASFEMPNMLHDYTIETNEPNIVYMGESTVLNIENKADGKSLKMKTIIETTNDSILYPLTTEKTGSKISTILVPGQEGTSNIDIFSSYKNSKNVKKKALVNEKVNITVCPAFNIDLLTSSTISIIKGTKHSVNIDFGEEACATDIIYKSNNQKIASVDSEGTITGINPGKTELLISKMGKQFSVPVIVTTSRVNMSLISIDQTKVQLMPGDSFRLHAKQMPSNSTSIKLNYSSTNTEVATVSNSGLIYAINPGSTVINVSSGKIKTSVLVIVNDVGLKQDEASGIAVDKESIILRKGNSHNIVTTVTPDSAINRLNKWESSDNKVAIVDYNGVVYANEIGTAEITVTNGSISKVIKVTVTQ